MWYFVSNNKQAHAAKRQVDYPAPTITGGHDSGNRQWVYEDEEDDMLYKNGTGANAALRDSEYPAPMIMFGQRLNKVEWVDNESPADETRAPARVSPEEAAALQSYPEDFIWEGAKSKVYLQIGNAVPPQLALSVLTALWSQPTGTTDEDAGSQNAHGLVA
jgi:DNA (cytosine-5)-methyltransferase 1